MPREHTVIANNSSSNETRGASTHGHHQMVNTEIRLIIFFAAKNGEAVHNSAKARLGADCDLIMNSVPNSD